MKPFIWIFIGCFTLLIISFASAYYAYMKNKIKKAEKKKYNKLLKDFRERNEKNKNHE